MGGPVHKTGTFGFELSASEIQQRLHTNLVPLGEVKAGVFQHRALLFKVLPFILLFFLFNPYLGRPYVTRWVWGVPLSGASMDAIGMRSH